MFPILSVLLAFVIALLYQETPERPPPDVEATLAIIVLVGLLAKLVADIGVRRVNNGGNVSAVLRMNLAMRGGALAVHALVIYGFHWKGVTGDGYLGIADWVLLDDLVVMAPFFCMFTLCYAAAWSAESRLGLHDFRLGAYLDFQLKQFLLPTLPLFVFLALKDGARIAADSGVRWLAEARIAYLSYPYVQWLALAGLLIVLYCLLPFLLRFMWKARPLPAGPLRDRLEAFAKRVKFTARNILVWPTGGNVLNAAVVGVAGPFRYVLLTDALIDTLDEDEIEAVFAHEAGHARHNHMFLFFLFTLGFALFSSLGAKLVTSRFPTIFDSEIWLVLFVMGLMIGWFGLFFGFISRRFEQQADVFGARATGRAREDGADPREHPFVRALAGLAEHLGDVRESKGWRHFSLASRVEFLIRFLSDPTERKRYRARIAQVFLIFFSVLGALGAAAAATVPDQLVRGRPVADLRRIQWLAQHDKPREVVWEYARFLEHAETADLTHLTALDASAVKSMYEFPPDISDPMELALVLHDLKKRARADPIRYLFADLQLARTYGRLGWHDEARETLFSALERYGEHPAVFYLLGRSFESAGRVDDARLAYEMALSVTLPVDSRARDRIEDVLSALGSGR